MLSQSRNVILIPPQTLSVSGVSGIIIIPEGYTSAILWLAAAGSPTGTTETLNVYVQHALRASGVTDTVAGLDLAATTYTLFDDFISFAQVTTSASAQVAKVVGGGNVVAANKDGTLAVGTVSNGPLGSAWRIKWVISGTSPTYPTTSLVAQFS